MTSTGGTAARASLLDDLRALLDDAVTVLGPSAQEDVRRLEDLLLRPLTMVVAGRTNAGKSTLVNALIGSRVAPTRQTECTRVVTWFRFGPDQSHVICTDGRAIPFWLTADGRLPDELPVPVGEVDHLDVWLDFEPLRALTVIDTPGLSGDEGLADSTERLLGSGDADVLLFVVGADVHDDERRILVDHRRRGREFYDFPGNAIGVLSKADQRRGPEGPWAAAQSVVADQSSALADQLAGVLAVMGKLAETAETGALNEDHAADLRALSTLPDTERDHALRYLNAFKNSDVLTPAARMALYERLDLYGIALLSSPKYRNSNAADMYDAVREHAGIAELRRRIEVLFIRPTEVHKGVRILAEIDRLTTSSDTSPEACDDLLDRIQTIRDSPAMHTLAELRSLAALYSGRCTIDDVATRLAVLRLFEGNGPAERLGTDSGDLAEVAAQAAIFWKALANATLSPAVRAVAETASTSAHLLHIQLRS